MSQCSCKLILLLSQDGSYKQVQINYKKKTRNIRFCYEGSNSWKSRCIWVLNSIFGTRANDTPLSTMIKIPSCTKQNIKHLPFIFYSHFTFLIIFPPVWHNMDSSFPSYNLLNFESIRFNILPSHSFITRIFKAISIYLHEILFKKINHVTHLLISG